MEHICICVIYFLKFQSFCFMYFNVSIPLTKIYNHFTIITACNFYPYENTQFVLLKRFVFSSTWPDVVTPIFMLTMLPDKNFPTFTFNFSRSFGLKLSIENRM